MALGHHGGGLSEMDFLYDEAMQLYQRSDYKAAFTKWMFGAEAGHAGCCHDTADCYRLGHGVQQDFFKAQDWYRKAVALNEVKSMSHLGTMLKKGQGSPVDSAAACKLWLQAPQSPDATLGLALSYLVGDGVEQNERLSVQNYSKMARGHPTAALEFAIANELGRGTRVDLAVAHQHYALAYTIGTRMNTNHRNAYMFAYARFTLLNSHSPEDDRNGFQLMHQLARVGGVPTDSRSANVWLAWLYATGRGVPRDVPRAIALYKRCRGDDSAARHLALLQINSEARPVPPEPNEHDPAEVVHIRGAGRGRWAVVDYCRNSNGYLYAEKQVWPRSVDVRRDQLIYNALLDATEPTPFVLLPHTISMQESKRLLLRQRWMAGGSLGEVMAQYQENKERIPRATLMAWTYQILRGIHAIHGVDGLHRHLTPNNIMFDDAKRQTLKVTDIGIFSCAFTDATPLTDVAFRDHQNTYVSCYWPPEVVRASDRRVAYTPAADIWSVGQMLVEGLVGRFNPNLGEASPWLAQMSEEETKEMLGSLVGNDEQSAELIELCVSMLRHDPNERAPLPQLLRNFAKWNGLPTDLNEAATAIRGKVLKVAAPQPTMGPIMFPFPAYGKDTSSSGSLSSTPRSSPSGGGASLSSMSSSSSSLSSHRPSSPAPSLSSMSSSSLSSHRPSTPTASSGGSGLSSSGRTPSSPSPPAASTAPPATRVVSAGAPIQQLHELLHDMAPSEWMAAGAGISMMLR